MKLIKIAIKKIPRYSCDIFVIFYYKILSLFYKDKNKFKDAWLICERGIEAKDNGYVFFKYLRENHPEKKVFYVIDFSQKQDYERVKKLGNLLNYNCFEHKMALFFASHFISTHYCYITPWSYLLSKKMVIRSNIYVLLQHGVTKEDMSQHLNKHISGIDIFITATKEENNSIINNNNYGFKENEVPLTGFARFDNLLKFNTKRQILFMPTWRTYLVRRNTMKKNKESLIETFEQSAYFKHLNSFLNNEILIELLEKNNIELIFYPHFEVQKSISLFALKSNKIIVAKKEQYDVQQLLKESLMLITDYSSVAFDFAYMKKPLIYYQFDQEEYYRKHYKKGYFDPKTDGFGEIATTEKHLIKKMIFVFKNNFVMEEKYIERVDKTFAFRDNDNCERIYNAINNYTKPTPSPNCARCVPPRVEA
jgi:CDP-glycerol glycerophosphotransferase (TagB/SpsB family)